MRDIDYEHLSTLLFKAAENFEAEPTEEKRHLVPLMKHISNTLYFHSMRQEEEVS